jgi:hypothetical protein
MVDGSIASFDRADSMVITVKLIAAKSVQVLQVALGLLVLVYQLPQPTGRVTDFDRVETRFDKLDDLAHGLGVFQPQHGDVG